MGDHIHIDEMMTDDDFVKAVEQMTTNSTGDIGDLLSSFFQPSYTKRNAQNKAMNENRIITWDEAERILQDADTEPVKCSLLPQTRPSEPDNDTDVEVAIQRLLDNDPTLTEINLNNMKRTPVPQIKRLVEALAYNEYCERISLANMGLYDHDVQVLVTVVEMNTALKKLNLETNYLSGEFFSKLFRAACENMTVEEIKCVNQGVSFATTAEKEIIQAIVDNKGLLKVSVNLRLPEGRHKIQNVTLRNGEIRRMLRREKALKAKREAEELAKNPVPKLIKETPKKTPPEPPKAKPPAPKVVVPPPMHKPPEPPVPKITPIKLPSKPVEVPVPKPAPVKTPVKPVEVPPAIIALPEEKTPPKPKVAIPGPLPGKKAPGRLSLQKSLFEKKPEEPVVIAPRRPSKTFERRPSITDKSATPIINISELPEEKLSGTVPRPVARRLNRNIGSASTEDEHSCESNPSSPQQLSPRSSLRKTTATSKLGDSTNTPKTTTEDTKPSVIKNKFVRKSDVLNGPTAEKKSETPVSTTNLKEASESTSTPTTVIKKKVMRKSDINPKQAEIIANGPTTNGIKDLGITPTTMIEKKVLGKPNPEEAPATSKKPVAPSSAEAVGKTLEPTSKTPALETKPVEPVIASTVPADGTGTEDPPKKKKIVKRIVKRKVPKKTIHESVETLTNGVTTPEVPKKE